MITRDEGRRTADVTKRGRPGFAIDTSVPHGYRVYDYWLGGRNNFEVDRAAAEQVIAAYPRVVVGVRAQRAFLGRVVRYLAAEAGIRQFLDIGTGLPSLENTHEVAQRAAPESRVVYVDNDPVVLMHARSLLVSSPEGATDFLDADLRDPGKILAEAARTLDFGQPVAVLLLGILHSISDEENPHQIVRRLVNATPSGSYLAISQIANDVAAQATRAMQAYNTRVDVPVTPRSQAEVARFFSGLDLLEPGLVQLHRWRPRAEVPGTDLEIPNYGGVGRKPLMPEQRSLIGLARSRPAPGSHRLSAGLADIVRDTGHNLNLAAASKPQG